MLRLGLDIGGTKIEAVVLGADGGILFRRRIPTPRERYTDLIDAVADLVLTAEREVGESVSVGAGIPGGPEPRTRRIRNANLQILNGQDLSRDLGAKLQREVRVANDANCFALSEAVDGAAKGASVVFGVIIGTGCGGGLVLNGRVWAGANGIGGEWGHNPLPAPSDGERPGPACYCGRFGCIETFVSGTGLAADFRRVTGRDVSARDIVQLAARGDPEADQALCRLESRLARALAVVINILDPEVIVLGGGLSQCRRLYENVPRLWAPHIFGDAGATRLVMAAHGDASGERGAAWLWPDARASAAASP